MGKWFYKLNKTRNITINECTIRINLVVKTKKNKGEKQRKQFGNGCKNKFLLEDLGFERKNLKSTFTFKKVEF